MKRSGRTIKQRLYDLKHLPGYMRRARYFRGHGVHSPYVYSIVREVFMRRELLEPESRLYPELMSRDIAPRRCVQLANLVQHCKYTSWSIDSLAESDIIFATLNTTYEHLAEYATYAREHALTLCIMNPYNNAERWDVCSRIIEEHPSTSVDNRAYLLIFNNHLPKQRFRL